MKPTRINSMLLVNLVLLSTILTAQDCSFDRYLGSGAHLVKRWSTLASRSEPG